MACNNKRSPETPEEPRAGGPCTYRYDTLPAKVIKIERQAGQQPRVIFAVLREQGADTTSYFLANNRDISEEEIKQKAVAEGAVFQMIDAKIKTGACNPHIIHIDLEKYTGRMPAARDTAWGG